MQAEEDVKRYTPLAEVGAVSKRDLEIAISRYEAQKGELDAALAQLNVAKTNLGYATVTAPITGLIGYLPHELEILSVVHQMLSF